MIGSEGDLSAEGVEEPWCVGYSAGLKCYQESRLSGRQCTIPRATLAQRPESPGGEFGEIHTQMAPAQPTTFQASALMPVNVAWIYPSCASWEEVCKAHSRAVAEGDSDTLATIRHLRKKIGKAVNAVRHYRCPEGMDPYEVEYARRRHRWRTEEDNRGQHPSHRTFVPRRNVDANVHIFADVRRLEEERKAAWEQRARQLQQQQNKPDTRYEQSCAMREEMEMRRAAEATRRHLAWERSMAAAAATL